MISIKIKKLRNKFTKFNIDGYVVPKNDSYFNEYSSPDRLKFISNFDGSAGLAIILKNKNYLFVDGRYTIQAKSQSGKNFDIIEIHKKQPWKVLKHKIKIGYNPYCFTSLNLTRYFKNYFKLVPIYNDLITKKRSRKVNNKFYFIKDHITGESSKSKINRVLKFLRDNKSDCLFVTAPENVAWLLNLRGRDNPHSPIPNCRMILKKNGHKNVNISSVKGPCLASGLANKIRTGTIIANKDIKEAQKIQNIIQTEYYKCEISDDIEGVEISSAIKNLYSMLIGGSQGLSNPAASKEIQEKYY